MTDDETRWLTYEDAASALGIDAASVKRRAQRGKWPRMVGNDRRVLVAVPAAALPQEGGDVSPDTPEALMASLMERVNRAFALEAENAALRATVAAQDRELRRWVRRSPTKHPEVVIRRITKLAKAHQR